MNKLNSILENHPNLIPHFFSPALHLRISSLVQRCLVFMSDSTDQVNEELCSATRDIVQEMQEKVLHMEFDEERPSSYEPLLNAIVSNSSFLTLILTSTNCDVTFIVLSELCSICESIQDSPTRILIHLLLLLHLSFTSAIHFRKSAIQHRFDQDRINVSHTHLLERIIRITISLLNLLHSSTSRAVVVNYISELMYSFVCKWKELYHTNDILMNTNVSAVSGTNKIVSIYGDNISQVNYYLPNFISFAAFHKLVQFLYSLTYYNNYRNPQAFAGAADFVAICIFERIFGIAYMQRQVEKTKEEVNWRQIVEIPSSWRCTLSEDDWIQKNGVTLIELPYVIVDSMKSSGKSEYYKSTGKTRLVFMMVEFQRRDEI